MHVLALDVLHSSCRCISVFLKFGNSAWECKILKVRIKDRISVFFSDENLSSLCLSLYRDLTARYNSRNLNMPHTSRKRHPQYLRESKGKQKQTQTQGWGQCQERSCRSYLSDVFHLNLPQFASPCD